MNHRFWSLFSKDEEEAKLSVLHSLESGYVNNQLIHWGITLGLLSEIESLLLRDFRDGKLGRLSFDYPNAADEVELN